VPSYKLHHWRAHISHNAAQSLQIERRLISRATLLLRLQHSTHRRAPNLIAGGRFTPRLPSPQGDQIDPPPAQFQERACGSLKPLSMLNVEASAGEFREPGGQGVSGAKAKGWDLLAAGLAAMNRSTRSAARNAPGRGLRADVVTIRWPSRTPANTRHASAASYGLASSLYFFHQLHLS
jgi:hypothetical protein